MLFYTAIAAECFDVYCHCRIKAGAIDAAALGPFKK